jgi:U3 small nucleolar RNA-associated protein 22
MGRIPKLTSVGKKGSRPKGNNVHRSSDVWGKDVNDLGYNESVCRGVVEVLSLALGDRVTAVRALTCGNGDIRESSSLESAEDIATKWLTDSDQSLAAPIRGTSNYPHSADLSARTPKPPVPSADQHEQYMVVGLRIDPNASRRVVDRGPPAEDIEGTNAFVSLWGEKFAQIRRFQDGAIVRAVVWNDASSNNSSQPENTRYSCDDKLMGGIVEKVVQHIVEIHFARGGTGSSNSRLVMFELRNMISFIEGVASEKPSPFSDSMSLHKNVLAAFESLSDFLRSNSATTIDNGGGKKISKLGLPLSIDEVEPLSPCLRYSSLFPPVPHPLIGGVSNLGSGGKVSGVVNGEPILIQIRFQSNNKWPSSLNAMSAAKCAMLIQLAEGIQKMKGERSTSVDMDAFDGPMDNTPGHLTIGYCGYSWRIVVRADQELRMLKSLKNPTVEAKRLQNVSFWCL